MCGFSFTVFLSAFQLLPTAPFHILALGGGTSAAGLFLGFLTYASAFSAPVTGTLADRVGPRRILITSSIAIPGFSLAYALIPSYQVMLAPVLVHEVFWSGALCAESHGGGRKGIYLPTLAVVIVVTRPLAGRLGDKFGYRRVFLPCLVLIAAGLSCLVFGGTRFWLVTSAAIFGAGFGTAYPVFASYVMRQVGAGRRGAAFGAILACF